MYGKLCNPKNTQKEKHNLTRAGLQNLELLPYKLLCNKLCHRVQVFYWKSIQNPALSGKPTGRQNPKPGMGMGINLGIGLESHQTPDYLILQ